MVSSAAERFLAFPWLAEMDSASLQAVLNVLIEKKAPAGAILLAQGQPNDHVSFLIEGTAFVSRVLENGRTESLTTLTAPSVFGLTSFFRPQPPGFSVKADKEVWYLTLDHHAHGLLRRADPKAAEGLAFAAARVLADRFDLMDKKVSALMAEHPEDSSKNTEWAEFRTRLFDEASI